MATEADQDTTHKDPRKLVAAIPEALLTTLRATCAEKTNLSLIGRVQGKHPGLKSLTAWARETLHSSFALLSLKANNLFEVTFTLPEGRIHALTQTDLLCDSTPISFSSWRPHLDSIATHATDQLDHPIWMQIVDLCQILRDESFLRIIGEQVGQVVTVDTSEAYRAKLFGPRIRLLVRDLSKLPHTVLVPRLDGDGVVEYALEFSGLPNQCGRCRSYDHQVRHCPRKDNKARRNAPQHQYPEWRRIPHRPRAQAATPATTPTTATANPAVAPTPTAAVAATITVLTAKHTEATSPPNLSEMETASTHTATEAVNTEAVTHEPPQMSLQTQETEPKISPQHTEPLTEEPLLDSNIVEPTSPTAAEPTLLPNDTNFPQLQTPTQATPPKTPTIRRPPDTAPPNTFVWRMKHSVGEASTEKGKEKIKISDSVPLTRQGYRSGQLAEDFWTALGMPNIPSTHKKKLRVIPFLINSRDEYLVDRKARPTNTITTVHVAEQLAGIPWTTPRARQHVVNEVAQSLHKVLIFNNTSTSPFQRWSQGHWHAQWKNTEGESICTLYVNLVVPEHKIKIRKGRELVWRKIPDNAPQPTTSPPEEIQDGQELESLWRTMVEAQDPATTATANPTTPNPYAALNREEANASS